MRVVVDAYWWIEGQVSGRRVVDSLVRTWAEAFPGDELTVAVPRRHLPQVTELVAGTSVGVVAVRRSPHGVSVLTELGRAATRAGADVVLAQNYTPLRTGALRATFVHDLMFDEHPEFFTRVERAYFAGMPWSARRADLVLTSTRAEGDRIARCRPELAGRVVPVGLGVPESFRSRRATDPGVGLTPGGFLLCVGRLNVRKNVGRLVEALVSGGGLVTPERPLVVVGEPDGKGAGPAPGDARVRFLGGVDDGSLAWLYANCRLFVFPSLDEGFGLPVVEAALSGAPMVLSDIPAFRELAPGAAFFDPHDRGSIAGAVRAELAGPPSPSPTVQVPSWGEVVGRIRQAVEERLALR
ncbi:glycosyltransferase involved in cell wall biosynthesis [Geodermatophilus bullaregiensis]|uniref:glycosyltransferase family 4 protein n=1 Tax=Geodermatophilus bullaregiensis TaxID=1564160 RepID=UPI00195A2B2B|nr:glycosyltransferase family 1 protein [Geodermatophilus bullaregiensis]MBM7807385.1 glycosyltransferase involved in cell wall biosynthesis [Geodermatophilus bullaregiensis]